MSPLRARVEKGRLVLDEPTTLPEGTVVDLPIHTRLGDIVERDGFVFADVLPESHRLPD